MQPKDDIPSTTESIREDLPLNATKKKSSCEECLGGSKFINASFGTLSIVITVALILQIYYGDYQVAPHGSVATDCLECSEIGTTILKKGGNAVDAAIASAFCLSVFAPHLTGLDADGQLLLYNHRSRNTATLVDFSDLPISPDLPRLVMGLAYCHLRYGYLSWGEVVKPSIKFARDGFLVSKVLVQAIRLKKAEELFGRLETSQLVKVPLLAETLESIANVSTKDLDSFISKDNSPTETNALTFNFQNYRIFVPNVPSVGPIFSILMQQIEKFKFTPEDTKKSRYFYKIAETSQIVYKDFQVGWKYQDGASTNVAVIDRNENYVSLVTGLPSLFGSLEMTASGYIMNPKLKGVRSGSLPIIIVDSMRVCGRRIVFGANNIALAAQIVSYLLVGGENVTESIENPRFHVAATGAIGLEQFHLPSFDKETSRFLQALTAVPLPVNEPYGSVNIVEKTVDALSSHSDSRGGGIASRFK